MIICGDSVRAVIARTGEQANDNKQIATVIYLGVHYVVGQPKFFPLRHERGTEPHRHQLRGQMRLRLGTFSTVLRRVPAGRAIEIMVYPYGEEYPEYAIPVVGITALTRYVTVGPNGKLYVTDYTDRKAYAVTVGTTAV